MSQLSLKFADNASSFAPGEELRLVVQWQDAKPSQELVTNLFWYTTGKGDRDMEIIEAQNAQLQSSQGEQSLSFKLPEFPYSFSGSLISIVWGVEVLLGNDSAKQEFILSPTKKEYRASAS